jgi:hypothetical protein
VRVDPGVTLTEGVRAALVVAIAEQQLWGYAACPQPAPDRRPGQDDAADCPGGLHHRLAQGRGRPLTTGFPAASTILT